VQPGTDGSNRDLHDGSDFVVAQLLHLSQHEGGAKIRRELIKKSLDDHAIFNRGTLARLGSVELYEFGPLQPQPIHAESNANSIEVTGEGPVVSQLSDLAEGFEERFLRNVFRFVPVAKEVRGGADEPHAMALNEQAKRSLVTRSNTSDPLPLKRGGIDRLGKASDVQHFLSMDVSTSGVRSTFEQRF